MLDFKIGNKVKFWRKENPKIGFISTIDNNHITLVGINNEEDTVYYSTPKDIISKYIPERVGIKIFYEKKEISEVTFSEKFLKDGTHIINCAIERAIQDANKKVKIKDIKNLDIKFAIINEQWIENKD